MLRPGSFANYYFYEPLASNANNFPLGMFGRCSFPHNTAVLLTCIISHSRTFALYFLLETRNYACNPHDRYNIALIKTYINSQIVIVTKTITFFQPTPHASSPSPSGKREGETEKRRE